MRGGIEVSGGYGGICRGSVQHPAGSIDDRDLSSSRQARIEPHGGAGARRGCEQQVVEVAREHTNRLLFRMLAQRSEQLTFDLPRQFDLPRGGGGLQQPGIRGPSLVGYPVTRANFALACIKGSLRR